ncbi:MAG TPA: protein kinase, partial [Jatrophihabitans sp.]|nr:protein kinase [Jatrophihabitans sp.]
IGAALAYLHSNGVVHGDVSAANILFLAGGPPLLADVGVARLIGDVSEVHSTPAYIDPAVAAGCVPGPQSDVFMLAAVALHALTGRPPWPAASGPAAIALAAQGRLDDVAARLADAGVPEPMTAVLSRALSVDPHRRGTAADFALDLRHSAEPIAVELAAGRTRRAAQPPGPRHAARPAAAARRSAASGRRRRAHTGRDAAPDSADDATRDSAAAQSSGSAVEPAGGHTDGGHLAGGPAPVISADPARPAFERPSTIGSATGAAPPTRLVGPRPRPVIPRARSGRIGARRVRPRTLAVLVAVVLAALGAAAGALWLAAASPSQHGAAPSRRAAAPQPANLSAPETSASASVRRNARVAAGRPPVAGGTPRSSAGSAGSSARPSPGGTGSTIASAEAAQLLAALERLDATRARAFATRNPHLLGSVYLPGALLRADTALLTRLVPTGCGLTGARTRYAGLRVSHRNGRTAVTATATLAASRLVCHGTVRAAAPRAGPATLRLELAQTATGLRIARQQVS